jgi:hypothetical protein
MAVKTLEERLEALEEKEAISTLLYEYAELCDAGYPADDLIELFVPEGAWVSNALGEFHGRDALHSFFEDIADDLRWARHYFLMPTIRLADDGLSAVCRWSVHEIATQRGLEEGSPNEPILITATDVITVRKVDSHWKFVRFDVTFHQISSLVHGWVDQPFRGQPDRGGPSQG